MGTYDHGGNTRPLDGYGLVVDPSDRLPGPSSHMTKPSLPPEPTTIRHHSGPPRPFAWFVTALMVLAVATSCSQGNYPLPDRKSKETKENEAEITEILEANDDIAGEDPSCTVRYLGFEDGARFAWAVCTGTYATANAPTSVSTIFRVTGDQAEWPRDATYVDDVTSLFPPLLADDALNNPNRLKP